MENKPSGGRFIAALLFFATTAGIAILLLLTALVIWLSSVTGSFIASALIAGGFFAVLALLVYLFAIRDAVSATGDHRIDPPLRAPATSEAILDAIDAVRAAA